ncbi:Polyribonucleotide nucleotidyltransferase [Candidatus Clavichlamydia salmonicola]|uniref:polyribonucleotide nucleotidyltransferase n=1 Tax=Candidatus Clavichlamydia salmonicola TaxID=469812 RepID=UPI0018918377|nr:polyribonucleotide nucleotidyltransferase [Candidatus Clavichlamydia salmonicola]MBF5050439.1 Polyribonucleotide nucleotidyltransferase [Candidatus Clavichlamydia salmonicola]
MAYKKTSITLEDGKTIVFETGKIAKQAGGSVLARLGDTIVFSTACIDKKIDDKIDFLPLRVDYQEKFSSAGKTLGGFIKREGRPTEREILVSRLIDRSMRPFMPAGYYNETQLLAYVWSFDGSNLPDPLAICAASAALLLSEAPITKAIAGVRVGYVGKKFIINPTTEEMKSSALELLISGTDHAILMIEGNCDFLNEEEVLKAIEAGHNAIKIICQGIERWVNEEIFSRKEKIQVSAPFSPELFAEISTRCSADISSAFLTSEREARALQMKKIEENLLKSISETAVNDSIFSNLVAVKIAFKHLCETKMKEQILHTGLRLDERTSTQIRPIDIEVAMLPRTHGSCLFTRGSTQTVAVCTLGGENMGQRFEDLNGEGLRKFYLQYSFPPFCVGEVGRIGSPGRREIGHGKLAEQALKHTLPDVTDFPYTIRLESNITESNGSSSMASVCGGCLALMDAGVPIKAPIAGIAMGLILNENKPLILSDISGTEDALGDMDFKIAGSKKGITAFQMDIKVAGITIEIMKVAINQAQEGIHHILQEMHKTLSASKEELSTFAPRIETMQIKPNKIAIVIGPGGKQIRQIIEETGVQIDINDSGLLSLASSDKDAMLRARKIIEGLTTEPEVGRTYQGRVTSIVAFGAFVEIFPGKEGLCHISEIAEERVEDVRNYLKEGDSIAVKLLSINEKGQLKLSRKATFRN